MIDVTHEAKEAYKKAIIAFLKQRIKTDSLVEEGCKNPKKTLDDCCKYIVQQARKQASNNVACIPDTEVYGWVVHYITEETPTDIEPVVLEEEMNTTSEEQPQKQKKVAKKQTIFDELQSEFVF